MRVGWLAVGSWPAVGRVSAFDGRLSLVQLDDQTPHVASLVKAPRAGTRLSGGAAEALGELKSPPDVSPHPGTSSFP